MFGSARWCSGPLTKGGRTSSAPFFWDPQWTVHDKDMESHTCCLCMWARSDHTYRRKLKWRPDFWLQYNVLHPCDLSVLISQEANVEVFEPVEGPDVDNPGFQTFHILAGHTTQFDISALELLQQLWVIYLKVFSVLAAFDISKVLLVILSYLGVSCKRPHFCCADWCERRGMREKYSPRIS